MRMDSEKQKKERKAVEEVVPMLKGGDGWRGEGGVGSIMEKGEIVKLSWLDG